MIRKFESRIPNENQTLSCENPECGRKDRPLYVWHSDNGRHSILICDICTVKSEHGIKT